MICYGKKESMEKLSNTDDLLWKERIDGKAQSLISAA
jgi:hypothetical protein